MQVTLRLVPRVLQILEEAQPRVPEDIGVTRMWDATLLVFHADVSNYDPQLASVQISLVNSVASQGVLEVAPGTQHEPAKWTERFERQDAGARRPRTVAIAVPAGSVTFYSSSLVHRGRANTHSKERLVLGLTLLGDGGVVPSGLPYALQPQDLGQWSLYQGRLREM